MPVKISSRKNVISDLHSSVGHWFEPVTLSTLKNTFVLKLPTTPEKSGWVRVKKGAHPAGLSEMTKNMPDSWG